MKLYLLISTLFLFITLSFSDNSHKINSNKAISSIISYPGFPNDTLIIDSVKFCIITRNGPNCNNDMQMKISFLFSPQDSSMIEFSLDSNRIINIFKINNIKEDRIDSTDITEYTLVSKLSSFKYNKYFIIKPNNSDYVIMYCETEKEIYRISFY